MLAAPSSFCPPLRPGVSDLVLFSRSVKMMWRCLSLLSGTRVLLEGHLVGDLALLLLCDAVALFFLGSLLGLDPACSGCVGQVDVHCGV